MAGAWSLMAVLVVLALAAAGCLEPNVDPEDLPPAAFAIAFSKDERDDSLVVAQVEAAADWNRLAIRAGAPGTIVELATGGDATERRFAVDGEFRRLSEVVEPARAGDVLEFCAAGGTTGEMTYSLTDLETNTVLYITTFQDILSCG